MSVVKSVRFWLSPEDRVLSHLAENTSHLAHEREELTCLWMAPYLTRFLKSQNTTLSFSGQPGSGKTVLASVIVDRLQDQIGGVTYNTLFVPISKFACHFIHGCVLHRPRDALVGGCSSLRLFLLHPSCPSLYLSSGLPSLPPSLNLAWSSISSSFSRLP